MRCTWAPLRCLHPARSADNCPNYELQTALPVSEKETENDKKYGVFLEAVEGAEAAPPGAIEGPPESASVKAFILCMPAARCPLEQVLRRLHLLRVHCKSHVTNT